MNIRICIAVDGIFIFQVAVMLSLQIYREYIFCFSCIQVQLEYNLGCSCLILDNNSVSNSKNDGKTYVWYTNKYKRIKIKNR